MKFVQKWKNFFKKSNLSSPQDSSTKDVDYKVISEAEFTKKIKKMIPKSFNSHEIESLKYELKRYKVNYYDRNLQNVLPQELRASQIHFNWRLEEVIIFKFEDNWYYLSLRNRANGRRYAMDSDGNRYMIGDTLDYYFECDDFQGLLNCIVHEITPKPKQEEPPPGFYPEI